LSHREGDICTVAPAHSTNIMNAEAGDKLICVSCFDHIIVIILRAGIMTA